MKRTKLSQRRLPDYTPAEEAVNLATHAAGGALGAAALILCVVKAAIKGSVWGVAGSVVFGVSMIMVYAVSSVYHGLRPGVGKKVMQVIDHCAIYVLIAGTYTPIALSALRPAYPILGWGILALEWGLGSLAITLTAIDLKKYNVFSMICYIGMGWAVLPFLPQTIQVMTEKGFWLLLAGGISYTVGAIMYGIGSKRKWMHSVFHVFVVLGSLFHTAAVYFYVI